MGRFRGRGGRLSYRYVRTALLGRLFPLMFRPTAAVPLHRLGSDYGGWWIPEAALSPNSICYCAGVGEDMTFDLALVQQYGCTVVALDPTPKAVSYVAGLELPSALAFLDVGVAAADGIARFYAPRNAANASFSMTNLQGTDRYVEAQVRSLASIMAELDHSHIDLLKLDIEGAEYEVLESLHRDGLRPTTLCVEFDQPHPIKDTWKVIKRLRRSGYDIAHVERFNITFVGSRASSA